MTETFEQIKQACLAETSINPIEIAERLMKLDCVRMHGPEHHFLDGAAFLTAVKNADVDFDLATALDKLSERAEKMPGAMCGYWGVCGSSASVGSALSILHGTSPLSGDEFYKDHMLYVSRAAKAIADVGGPRCCKRNAFLSLSAAVDFVNEKYCLKLQNKKPVCVFSNKNAQCLKSRCPFHVGD